MTIYPAIDIKGGRCVRLTQGRADQETIYAENPADVARGFLAVGSEWVHVVDLDGAFQGEPQNLPVVQAIAALGMKVQLGGGLRSRAAVERALGFGVSRVVVGTRAAESEAFVGELVQSFGNKIAVGIDAKNGGSADFSRRRHLAIVNRDCILRTSPPGDGDRIHPARQQDRLSHVFQAV